jgi:CxxC motif-containing protein (DUF1111 family)
VKNGLHRIIALLAGAAALTLSACENAPVPGEPLRDLTAQERERFNEGRKLFSKEFTPESGLGPLFNEVSCVECHEEPAPGGSGDEVEIHATRLLPDGFCDPLADLGGPVYQRQVTRALHNALGIDLEPIPEVATAQGMRSSPDLFGFGLLDAVPDSVLLALADPEDRDHDGISGRPNRFVDGRIGRFGRKAFVPTLSEFGAGAFPNEQGVTTPEFPDEGTVGGQPIPPGVDPVPEPEIDSRSLSLVNDFLRFLAPPPPGKLTRPVRRGRGLFQQIGCTLCHIPSLKTGSSPVKALAYRRVYAYTDLLLHDMGPDLADICLGQATPSEFRTEPLMGLGLSKRFLHDGRASSLEEAVRAHGGEAKAARDRFLTLTPSERAALLQFLKSL